MSKFEPTRRDVVKGAAAGVVVAAASSFDPAKQALAASNVVTGYGVTTSQLKDWSIMTASIGLEMQWTGTNADIGTYMRDVISNDLGETHDIFIFDGGTEDILGPKGHYAVLQEDHPELTLWDRTSDDWKRTDLLKDAAGVQYGVPVIGNGDSFGYFPDKLGASADGMDEISFEMLYESEVTRGRCATDQSWLLSGSEMAHYCKHHGRVEIEDATDCTGAEMRQVVDIAIEWKKAGQFRTLHTAFEEQVQLLANREVDIINCWEPATKNANLELGADIVKYAFTVEGYYKWGHGAYMHVKAKDRGNVDNIHKMLNYYMSGEYRAYQAEQRGYAGPNMDLGIEYATANGWSEDQIANLAWTEKKVNKKFEKPFFGKPAAIHAAEMEEEWQRFLNV